MQKLIENQLHPKIQQIISEYLAQVNQAKQPGFLEGFYIYGSIALGDYSLALSDIDFIAVTAKRLQQEEIELFKAIHRNIERKYKKPNMNGIYITWDDLGKLPDEIEPYPYYCDGRMHPEGDFELNAVTWSELKSHGITLIGPKPSELSFTVDWDRLIADMHTNLNTYWKNWIERSSRFSLNSAALYFSRAQVEWGVLGITRLFFTFRENDITSKGLAGEYALGVIPDEWHKIVQEAVNFRRGASTSLYASRRKRKTEALRYMEYMLTECNKLFVKN